MTPQQRTGTADGGDNPQLPDDEDIKVGDDINKPAGRKKRTTPTSRKDLGRPARKRGRLAGPARVAMNVRILLETDDLVTEIGEATGMGPQQITDAAIAHYAQHLRRTGKLPKASEKKDQKQPEVTT